MVVAAAAGGVAALGGSGQAAVVRTASSSALASDTSRRVELPPLPRHATGHVVEPVAGVGVVAAVTPAATAAALPSSGPKPTAAASSTQGDRHGDSTAGASAVSTAVALGNGVALPPLDAPEAVKRIIEAGNTIARTPYVWGGGHGKWQDNGYDCSGSVSYALAAAGLLNSSLTSGQLAQWGDAGPGRWVTIYANATHVFLEVAGIRFDTGAQSVTGSRWADTGRSTAGFTVRHPPGL